MSDDFISISGLLQASSIEGTRANITPDEAAHLVGILATDATWGTYTEFFPGQWEGKWAIEPDRQAKILDLRPVGEAYQFTIGINPTLFDAVTGGLQHLIGILAGDLLNLRVAGFEIKSCVISHVALPESWKNALNSVYRENAYSISELRKVFQLAVGEPLLAFTIKPRLGLKIEALSELALSVLKAGFAVVELDTRNLPTNTSEIDALIELALKAEEVGKGKRTTRFSINVSGRASLALDVVGKLISRCSGIPTVKVDGGLDGLTTLQAIRVNITKNSPVITTYPLLRRLLETKLGADTFNEALFFSGTDILYPGNAPSLAGAYRELDHGTETAIGVNVQRYMKIVANGGPMPTIAGGVYPGQLQAYYELLGPDVAYFLGGAVALHKKGPEAGAHLCVSIIKTAMELRDKAKPHEFSESLPKKLYTEIEGEYPKPPGSSDKTLPYISPEIFKNRTLRPWSR